MKSIRPVAAQPGEDLVHPLQGGALLPVLQPVQGRCRNAELPREGLIRGFTTALAQELGKLPVELRHGGILLARSFRMRNNCRMPVRGSKPRERAFFPTLSPSTNEPKEPPEP